MSLICVLRAVQKDPRCKAREIERIERFEPFEPEAHQR